MSIRAVMPMNLAREIARAYCLAKFPYRLRHGIDRP